MARLAAAFGTSHSVMLAAQLEDWLDGFRLSDQRMPFFDLDGERRSYAEMLARAPAERAAQLASPEAIARNFHATQQAMERMKSAIESANLDALVIVGDDQHELFLDQHMPSLAVYYGETIRNASRADGLNKTAPEAWYARAQARRLEDAGEAHYPVHAKLARYFIEGLIDKDFDVSAVAGLADGQFEGHAYSFIHRWYLRNMALPVVPVFLNTYNPPNTPRPARCVALGNALRELIMGFPEDLRVGVIASGGLSHFICEEAFDRRLLEAMQRNDLDYLAQLDPQALKGGSSEIRNWIVTAAAAVDLEIDWLTYLPVYRTPALSGIGLCFAAWKAQR